MNFRKNNTNPKVSTFLFYLLLSELFQSINIIRSEWFDAAMFDHRNFAHVLGARKWTFLTRIVHNLCTFNHVNGIICIIEISGRLTSWTVWYTGSSYASFYKVKLRLTYLQKHLLFYKQNTMISMYVYCVVLIIVTLVFSNSKWFLQLHSSIV